MTSPRKATTGFWIIVALVAVLVGYPLSYGPWMALVTRGLIPEWFRMTVGWVYAPIEWIFSNSPVWARYAISRYFEFWLP